LLPPQTNDETIPDALLQDLIKALEKNMLSAAAVQATVGNFLSGKYLSCQQVIGKKKNCICPQF
jgi:hypothetical protein